MTDSDEGLRRGKKPARHIPTEIYICSCRKEYNSFPALYLHNKIKHGIHLKVENKKNMVRRSVWSGTRKKTIYEFPEESEGQQSQESELPERKRTPSQKNKELPKEVSQKRGPTISDTLNQYIREGRSQNICESLISGSILIKTHLENCVKYCSGKIYKMERRGQIEKIDATPANLPYLFNYFLLEYLPRCPQDTLPAQQARSFLSRLSSWLHLKGYTQHLAVPNS